MINIAKLHPHWLPYGVFISNALRHYHIDITGEVKLGCNKVNEIWKPTLHHIGLKKNEDGWVFKDECMPIMDENLLSSVDETPFSSKPKTEFENFVVDQFQRHSAKLSTIEKSINEIHKKIDKALENNVFGRSSEDGTDDEEDQTEEDSMETSDSD